MFSDLLFIWPWHPWVLAVLVGVGLLYLWAVRGVRQRQNQDTPVKTLHIVRFFTALLLLVLVMASPLNTIGRTQLFFVHAIQVVLITTVCVPLALTGCPASLLYPIRENPVVRIVVRFLVSPLPASLIFNCIFLIWHVPVIYTAAMAQADLYQVMLLMFFFAAFLPWFPVMGSLREWRMQSYPKRMFYVFADGQPVDIFALFLMMSGLLAYPAYKQPAGMGALADQITGGVLLLIPGAVDLAVMTTLFLFWMRQIEARTRLADQKRMEEMEGEDD